MRKVLRYKGLSVNAFGLPVSLPEMKRTSNSKRNYLRHQCFVSTFRNNAPRDLVVMYDIPHKKKSAREWLLRQLKKFDYIMIQRGGWVGPSPLPKDFLSYVRIIGLSSQLRILKLAKPFLKSDKNYKNIYLN